jgi:hypothetical protein
VRIIERNGAPAGTQQLPGTRVWVAATRAWAEPQFDEFLERMRSCFALEQRHVFPGYEVMAYRTDQPLSSPPCVIVRTP